MAIHLMDPKEKERLCAMLRTSKPFPGYHLYAHNEINKIAENHKKVGAHLEQIDAKKRSQSPSSQQVAPPCPGCRSQPASLNVDDVCPKCGEYLFKCGIVTLPTDSQPRISRLHAPFWQQIPPSMVNKARERTTIAHKVKTTNKNKARDRWIYKQCLKGIAHDKIVAELRRKAPAKKWQVVSTKQRIRQIGIAYADDNSLERPAARQS